MGATAVANAMLNFAVVVVAVPVFWLVLKPSCIEWNYVEEADNSG
jgi:hypothetical protein